MAKTVMFIEQNKVSTERRNFKPVEFSTSGLGYLKSFVSVNYEAGRHTSLELC